MLGKKPGGFGEIEQGAFFRAKIPGQIGDEHLRERR